jgi:hypothetical protein
MSNEALQMLIFVGTGLLIVAAMVNAGQGQRARRRDQGNPIPRSPYGGYRDRRQTFRSGAGDVLLRLFATVGAVMIVLLVLLMLSFVSGAALVSFE